MTTSRPAHFLPHAPHAVALIAVAVLAAACASRTPAPVVDRQAVPRSTPGAPSAAAPAPGAAPAARPPAPEPDWRPPTYTVKRGDTLYQIALEHGLDYRELAQWNGIDNINLIRVGQALRLSAPGSDPPATVAADVPAAGTTITPLRTAPPVGSGDSRPSAPPPATTVAVAPPTTAARPSDGLTRTSPKAIKEPWSEQAMRDVARAGSVPDATLAKAAPAATPSPSTTAAVAVPSPGPAPPPVAAGPSPGDDEGLDWVWPAKGRLVAQFSENASLKGIDIAGSSGDAVLASAPGKVVYAGNGLRGYGKLVIIKHNATYLTAYAHNNDILVKEGQSVTRGQKIAEMGSTDADRVKLHFEIRRLGKPMDPLRFLPPA